MYDKNAYKIAYKCMTKTRIQMYEQKQAYKCMTKTRVQTRIQMYEKNTYKCMSKTCIQTHIQMYDKNTDTNVWKKQAYKCMTKTRIQTRIQMYEKNTETNVWEKHKHAYKCMTKTRTQMYDKNILIYWTANSSTQGAWGALLKCTSAVARRWIANPPAVSPPFIYLFEPTL